MGYILPRGLYKRYMSSLFTFRGLTGEWIFPDEHEKEVARLHRVTEKYKDSQPIKTPEEKP